MLRHVHVLSKNKYFHLLLPLFHAHWFQLIEAKRVVGEVENTINTSIDSRVLYSVHLDLLDFLFLPTAAAAHHIVKRIIFKSRNAV